MEDKLKNLIKYSKDEISSDFTLRTMDTIFLKKAMQRSNYKPIIPAIFFKIVFGFIVICIGLIIAFSPISSASNLYYVDVVLNYYKQFTSIFSVFANLQTAQILISVSILILFYFILDLFLQRKFHNI